MADFPLLVEWSPSCVRLLDPATGASRYGASLAECEPPRGRDVVVAISRRSAFVRSLTVPATSNAQIAEVIGFQMAQSLPLGASEVVFGFRLGANVPGKGRLAAVGAVRTESLTRIHEEARAAGLRVRAVLPVAFGSWLAARSLGDCAVVAVEDDVLNIDLVKDGELLYSRTVPGGDPEDEVARTFAIAEVAPMPVLALAAPEIAAEKHDPKEALAYLGDPKAIDRFLFNIEPPAAQAARSRRAERWKAQRAILATGFALGLAAYAYSTRKEVGKTAKPTGVTASLVRERKNQREAEERLAKATRANRVLDVAFRPAQTLGDVAVALANAAGGDVWFTGLSIGRGAPVMLNGLALKERDVSRCLASLSKDARFSGMKVVSTSKNDVGKVPVTQFTITGAAQGTLPFDRPMKRSKDAGKAKSPNR